MIFYALWDSDYFILRSLKTRMWEEPKVILWTFISKIASNHFLLSELPQRELAPGTRTYPPAYYTYSPWFTPNLPYPRPHPLNCASPKLRKHGRRDRLPINRSHPAHPPPRISLEHWSCWVPLLDSMPLPYWRDGKSKVLLIVSRSRSGTRASSKLSLRYVSFSSLSQR